MSNPKDPSGEPAKLSTAGSKSSNLHSAKPDSTEPDSIDKGTDSQNTLPDNTVGRLRWRCRRGMRELDRAMLGYLDHHYKDAEDDEKKRFQALLEVQDPELMSLVSGKSSNPEFASIIAKIRATLTA